MDAELSELMADAARELQGRSDAGETMDRAVRLAVQDIDGCDAAGLSIVRSRGQIETLAATNEVARLGDHIQYETGEGPCLDSIKNDRTVSVPDMRRDQRWPIWAARMAADTDVGSMLSFQLFTEADRVGALNLYSMRANGFDDDDHDYGLALAAHIAVAVRAAQQIETLQQAVDSRALVGMAVGLVMERYNLDQDTAFAVLTRLASSAETKVRDIAAQVVETRRLPGGTGSS